MSIEKRDKKLNKAKKSKDTSETLRIAIKGLQEIQELSFHHNSDSRIRDITDNILWDIANNLPTICQTKLTKPQ